MGLVFLRAKNSIRSVNSNMQKPQEAFTSKIEFRNNFVCVSLSLSRFVDIFLGDTDDHRLFEVIIILI